MHPMILGICILAAYVGMAVCILAAYVGMAAWFEWEIRREPMNLQAPHHIFITIDHDRQYIRVIDDERETTLPWNWDGELAGLDVGAGLIPTAYWRVKAVAE